jgi:hypothetical protein
MAVPNLTKVPMSKNRSPYVSTQYSSYVSALVRICLRLSCMNS